MTRKLTYAIVVCLIADLVWRLCHIFGYISYPQIPSAIALVVGPLVGGSLLRATVFFEERSAKRILYALGSAALLYTFASAVDYFKIEMLRWPVLILCLAIDMLVLGVCVSHLREPEKKHINMAASPTHTRSYELSSQFGFVLGLVVAAIPILIQSLPVRPESKQVTGSTLRLSGLGLLLLGCLMEFVAPSRRWRLGLTVGLGMPGAVFMKFVVFALLDNSVGHLVLVMSIGAAAAVFFGPLAAFAGIFLGLTIKAIFKLG